MQEKCCILIHGPSYPHAPPKSTVSSARGQGHTQAQVQGRIRNTRLQRKGNINKMFTRWNGRARLNKYPLTQSSAEPANKVTSLNLQHTHTYTFIHTQTHTHRDTHTYTHTERDIHTSIPFHFPNFKIFLRASSDP